MPPLAPKRDCERGQSDSYVGRSCTKEMGREKTTYCVGSNVDLLAVTLNDTLNDDDFLGIASHGLTKGREVLYWRHSKVTGQLTICESKEVRESD